LRSPPIEVVPSSVLTTSDHEPDKPQHEEHRGNKEENMGGEPKSEEEPGRRTGKLGSVNRAALTVPTRV
jgi:hypothetical protein